VRASRYPTLLEEAHESWDQFISDEIVYATERCDPCFETAVAVRDWLSEYKLKRLWLELNFVPVRKSNTDFSAVVEMSKLKVGELFPVGMRDLAAHFGGSDSEHPMLIDSRKAIQYPQRVLLERVPSVIWLKGFDHSNGSRQNILDSISEPLTGVVANRKGRRALGACRVKSRQTPRELIQAGSKRVDKLSDQKRNFNRDTFALDTNDMNKFLRIILSRDGVRFWVKDLAQFGLNFVEVACGTNGFKLQIS